VSPDRAPDAFVEVARLRHAGTRCDAVECGDIDGVGEQALAAKFIDHLIFRV